MLLWAVELALVVLVVVVLRTEVGVGWSRQQLGKAGEPLTPLGADVIVGVVLLDAVVLVAIPKLGAVVLVPSVALVDVTLVAVVVQVAVVLIAMVLAVMLVTMVLLAAVVLVMVVLLFAVLLVTLAVLVAVVLVDSIVLVGVVLLVVVVLVAAMLLSAVVLVLRLRLVAEAVVDADADAIVGQRALHFVVWDRSGLEPNIAARYALSVAGGLTCGLLSRVVDVAVAIRGDARTLDATKEAEGGVKCLVVDVAWYAGDPYAPPLLLSQSALGGLGDGSADGLLELLRAWGPRGVRVGLTQGRCCWSRSWCDWC